MQVKAKAVLNAFNMMLSLMPSADIQHPGTYRPHFHAPRPRPRRAGSRAGGNLSNGLTGDTGASPCVAYIRGKVRGIEKRVGETAGLLQDLLDINTVLF